MIKKSIILALLALGTLVSCGEKKDAKTSEKATQEAAAKMEQEKAAAEEKIAMEKAEALKKAEAEKMEMAKRKADSIRQVKEHGHAH